MDYCRSTGILTIFDEQLIISTGLSVSPKKASPRGPAGNWCPEVLFGALFDAL